MCGLSIKEVLAGKKRTDPAPFKRTKKSLSAQIGPVIPKNQFALSYPDFIREIGCLSETHTNRCESKNGDHKRRARRAHNPKNIPVTIMRCENEYQAVVRSQGAFAKPICIHERAAHLGEFPKEVREYVSENFPVEEWTLLKQVTYKNSDYISKDNQAILYYPPGCTDTFDIGRNLAFVVSKKKEIQPVVHVVFQKYTKNFLRHLGIYECQITEEISHTEMGSLGHFHPIYPIHMPKIRRTFVSLKYEPLLD